MVQYWSLKMAENREIISFLLRIGLAFVFIYASVASFLNPNSWVGYVPNFIREVVNPEIFLKIHGVFEMALGIWLVSNKGIKYAGILSILSLMGIIAFNISDMDIIFRDVAILLMAAALTVFEWKN